MITLSETVESFLMARKAEGVSPKTLTWYAGKLHPFVAAIGDRSLTDINPNVIRTYLVSLRERKVRYEGLTHETPGSLSDRTIAGHDRMLRLFFKWAVTERLITTDDNPMARIRKPKAGVPPPKMVQMEDLRAMIRACDDTPLGRRNLAMLLFLIDTGCRAGGLVKLRDLDLHLEQRRAMVTEKGNKSRWVYLSEVTVPYLRQWLSVRPASAQTVFCGLADNGLGKPLGIEGLHRTMSRLAQKAGVIGRYNPHGLRHLFAIQNLENGNDLFTVSQLLGHSDIKTTEGYLQWTDKQRAQRHDLFSPTNGLKDLLING